MSISNSIAVKLTVADIVLLIIQMFFILRRVLVEK